MKPPSTKMKMIPAAVKFALRVMAQERAHTMARPAVPAIHAEVPAITEGTLKKSNAVLQE